MGPDTFLDSAPMAMKFTINLDDIAILAMGALGLSMLIFPEGILLSRTMAEKHGYDIDPDRELMAPGAANLAAGAGIAALSGGSGWTGSAIGAVAGGVVGNIKGKEAEQK